MQSVRVLSPRPPVRAVAIAAGVALLGVLLVVAPGLFGWSAYLIVSGVLLLIVSVVLGVVAFGVNARMRVRVTMDDEGYAITGPTLPQRGRWTDVTRVTQAPGRLVLHEDERRVTLIDPSGSDAALTTLGAEIGRYLDRSRGYGGG